MAAGRTPAGYEAGKKYPLVLIIHGRPGGALSLESFIGRFSVYPLASLASLGYAILRPNPRGSSGYGKSFRFANIDDWGGGDYEDDMAGVDHVISMGVGDPEHLAVMGWSYGGYMTSWIVTHTNRFKAACVGAGVTNLWSFTGTSDIPGFLPDYFGGEPWEQFQAFAKHSPITFIKNVKTPTLVLHGEADIRVPTSQGYEFYHALKTLGVTTKMVVYPRTQHGPREPKFVLDIAQRNIDWVEKYAALRCFLRWLPVCISGRVPRPGGQSGRMDSRTLDAGKDHPGGSAVTGWAVGEPFGRNRERSSRPRRERNEYAAFPCACRWRPPFPTHLWRKKRRSARLFTRQPFCVLRFRARGQAQRISHSR